MKKISFKNPKGGTLYLAKVGFDWGAFWAMFFFGGLPFFLRKMNMLGMFCLGFLLIETLGFSLGAIVGVLDPKFDSSGTLIGSIFFSFAFSLYFGIRGGKLSARHYVEEGYECVTKDEALLARARAKWEMEI